MSSSDTARAASISMTNFNESSMSYDYGAINESHASQSLAPLTTGGRNHQPYQFTQRITSADIDTMEEFPDDIIDQLYNQIDNVVVKQDEVIEEVDEEQQHSPPTKQSRKRSK